MYLTENQIIEVQENQILEVRENQTLEVQGSLLLKLKSHYPQLYCNTVYLGLQCSTPGPGLSPIAALYTLPRALVVVSALGGKGGGALVTIWNLLLVYMLHICCTL